jgi:hypothetical protein
MFKNLLFLLIGLQLISVTTNAEWVPLENSRTQKTPPRYTLLSNDQNSSVIKVEISGFELNEFSSGSNTYQSVDLLSEMFVTDPGRPEVPYLAKILAVPDQSAITLEIIATGEVHTFRDILLPPARPSWYEGEAEPPYAESRDAYRSERPFPGHLAAIDPPSVFRDFRIARVSVYPVSYNPAKKELQVYSSVTVRVNYGPGKVVNPRTAQNKGIAPSFGKIYRSTIFNYQEVLNNLYGGREDGRELILCIMPDEFAPSFQVYADWRRQSGTDVKVTKFFEIGGNTNNPDVIKAYIANAYHTWEYPPTYVLIIGDDGVFPKKTVTYPDYSFANEDFFVEIDGNDYFPEMMIGRFTNQGDYRMQVMIKKFMLYEKTPYTANTAWFKKGTVCSNNEYESQKETKRFAANMMKQYGMFTSVDTLMSDGSGWGWDCTVDLQDVTNAINEGRSYLNYRGEGWTDGWQASCYNFRTSDVSSLTNGEKFTFVTSIGCGVAMFDTWGANNCFGEEWIEGGTLTAPKGGVAFLGPTSNTHTTYNNKIDKGIYIGMFLEGMDTPGQALLRGKLYMYNVYGNEYYVEYHYKVYCVLGDPSIHIWKDVPLAVNVTYPETILVGPHQLEFGINFTSSGLPVKDAQLTLAGDEIFVTGFSDNQGKVYLDITPELPDTLMLTVRGGNVYPFQASIIIIQPAELVMPQNNPLVTDLDGNDDGLINPNENGTIAFTLKNWGSQTANNVTAILSAPGNDLIEIITTNPVSFGNIVSGGVFTGNPFQFYISPECPVGQVIPLQLHVTSTQNSWDYNYNLEVKGCQLAVNSFMVNDLDSPDPNYRMDPGETVMLFISVMNDGEDIAPDVCGELTSNDPNITVADAVGAFGTIGINGTKLNNSNYFVVSVSSNCPAGYLAHYSLRLFTMNGNYPYEITHDLYIPVSLPMHFDYTGPDAYGYYAYSSDDIFDQAPAYEWFEINGVGSQLNVAGNGDYTETVTLPFAFKYYGINYSQLRISTDGWIAFGGGSQTSSVNSGLPNNDNINCMAASFWDDLYDNETIEGNILFYSDAVNHRFIIEWDSIARNDFGAEPSIEVFQAVLYDPAYYPTLTGDGEIVFQYRNLDKTESSTVGIENHNQDTGLQYVFNNAYNPTASVLTDHFAIKFTTEPPFASIITAIGDEQDNKAGSGYLLGQNNPNPFLAGTRITYSLPVGSSVSLKIFNMNGIPVRTLKDGTQSAGSYSVEWDGTDNAGIRLSPGIYFYQLRAENYRETRKMFMLK